MVLLPVEEEELNMETRDASPSHLVLQIELFSLLSKNGIEEYESREFEAGDHKCIFGINVIVDLNSFRMWLRLVIYPDGDEIGKRSDHVSAYLSIVDTDSLSLDWEVYAMFTIFLYNQILDNYACFRGKERRFHALNSKWGFPKLISKKSFTDISNGYLVGNNCVFGAEVFVIKSQRVIERVSVREVYSPYKHDLVIQGFSKLEPKVVWTSEEFIAGNYKWKILLYPNGYKSAEGHYVSIYLECVDAANFAAHEKMKADICIRIRNKNHDKHYTKIFSNWFSAATQDWGYHEFIVIGDMRDPSRGFIVDDSCYLETEISIKVIVRDAPK